MVRRKRAKVMPIENSRKLDSYNVHNVKKQIEEAEKRRKAKAEGKTLTKMEEKWVSWEEEGKQHAEKDEMFTKRGVEAQLERAYQEKIGRTKAMKPIKLKAEERKDLVLQALNGFNVFKEMKGRAFDNIKSEKMKDLISLSVVANDARYNDSKLVKKLFEKSKNKKIDLEKLDKAIQRELAEAFNQANVDTLKNIQKTKEIFVRIKQDKKLREAAKLPLLERMKEEYVIKISGPAFKHFESSIREELIRNYRYSFRVLPNKAQQNIIEGIFYSRALGKPYHKKVLKRLAELNPKYKTAWNVRIEEEMEKDKIKNIRNKTYREAKNVWDELQNIPKKERNGFLVNKFMLDPRSNFFWIGGREKGVRKLVKNINTIEDLQEVMNIFEKNKKKKKS